VYVVAVNAEERSSTAGATRSANKAEAQQVQAKYYAMTTKKLIFKPVALVPK
jgi:hypothetical protein